MVSVWISAPERNAAAYPTSDSNSTKTSGQTSARPTLFCKGERRIIPDRYRTLALDETTLQEHFGCTRRWNLVTRPRNTTHRNLAPPARWRHGRFRFVESPIMEPGLSAKYPEIKSYVGRGLDDQTAYTRFGWTYKGFHAIIFSDKHSTVYIDAYSTNDIVHTSATIVVTTPHPTLSHSFSMSQNRPQKATSPHPSMAQKAC
jgi:hypothetical protein